MFCKLLIVRWLKILYEISRRKMLVMSKKTEAFMSKKRQLKSL